MAEILEDGVKLTDKEGAFIASSLSLALCLLTNHEDEARRMLANVAAAAPIFGSNGLNAIQARLGECAQRVGLRVKHIPHPWIGSKPAVAEPEPPKKNTGLPEKNVNILTDQQVLLMSQCVAVAVSLLAQDKKSAMGALDALKTEIIGQDSLGDDNINALMELGATVGRRLGYSIHDGGNITAEL